MSGVAVFKHSEALKNNNYRGYELMSKKRAAREDRPFRIEVTGELDNSSAAVTNDRLGLVHAAHAACAGGSSSGCLLVVFLDVSDEGFGSQHKARDGPCVLQREARDLGWID